MGVLSFLISKYILYPEKTMRNWTWPYKSLLRTPELVFHLITSWALITPGRICVRASASGRHNHRTFQGEARVAAPCVIFGRFGVTGVVQRPMPYNHAYFTTSGTSRRVNNNTTLVVTNVMSSTHNNQQCKEPQGPGSDNLHSNSIRTWGSNMKI